MNEERKVINISKPNRTNPTAELERTAINAEAEQRLINIEVEQKQEIVNISKSEVKNGREEEIAEFNRQVDAQIAESIRKKKEEEAIIISKKQAKAVKIIIILLFLSQFLFGSVSSILSLILSRLFST